MGLTLYQKDRDELIAVPSGLVFVIPEQAAGILRSYWKTEWEGPLVQWAVERMPPGKSLLDAGAHVGTWTLTFARAGHFVHAFEPTSKLASCLRAAAEINGCSENVRVHQLALGNTCTEADLRVPSPCGACSSLSTRIEPVLGTEKVSVCTLDSLGLQNIGLIKLDVEAYELEVIQGAVDTLRHNGWPPILYEGVFEDLRADLSTLLTRLGYTIREIKGKWPTTFLASDHPCHSL